MRLLAAFVAPVLVGVVFKIVDQLLQRFIFVEGIVDTRIQVLMAVVIDTCTVEGGRSGCPVGGVYRFDACELRPSSPVGSGAVLYIPSRVGSREFVLVVEVIFESTPQVVGDAFVLRPVLLQDIVPLSVDGRFRMHIFRRAAVPVARRVGEVRRIFLSRVRQVHPSRRREIISLFSRQRHFPFQDILQTLVVLDNQVDGGTLYTVLRRGTIHHLHLFHLIGRGRLQHVGQLFRCHAAFPAVDDDRRARCAEQRDIVAFLFHAR